ncbi:MAG: MGMT family protein [Planctomycetes bacterium]|nr:MGMT family protein [Planctomycetota bacterium]
MVRYCLVPTAWGPFTIVMRGGQLLRSKLPDESRIDEYTSCLRELHGAVEEPHLNPELQDSIQRYFEGETGVRFRARLAFDGLTDFQKAILRTCRVIAYGNTRSYGELATRAGFPNAARAVGSVMARNPHPLITPCHRVIAAGRRIGGFSSDSGTELKRAMLELEGTTEIL